MNNSKCSNSLWVSNKTSISMTAVISCHLMVCYGDHFCTQNGCHVTICLSSWQVLWNFKCSIPLYKANLQKLFGDVQLYHLCQVQFIVTFMSLWYLTSKSNDWFSCPVHHCFILWHRLLIFGRWLGGVQHLKEICTNHCRWPLTLSFDMMVK